MKKEEKGMFKQFIVSFPFSAFFILLSILWLKKIKIN